MSLTNYFKKLSFKDPPKPEAKESDPHEEEKKRDPPYHTCKKPFTWICDGYPPTPFISDHWFHEQYFKKGVDPESQMDFRSTSDLPESPKMKPPDKTDVKKLP